MELELDLVDSVTFEDVREIQAGAAGPLASTCSCRWKNAARRSTEQRETRLSNVAGRREKITNSASSLLRWRITGHDHRIRA